MRYLHSRKLLEEKNYTDSEIKGAALIVHTKVIEKYGLKSDEIKMVFEEGSNFTQLKTPIIDEFGNEYWDSEGYYMSQRIKSQEIKKLIAFCSIGHGLSKKAAYLNKDLLEVDSNKKIKIMRKAIKYKFDNNSELKDILMKTGNLEIIEYTYRGDIFFGIDSSEKKGANILGKLLMEYRQNNKDA